MLGLHRKHSQMIIRKLKPINFKAATLKKKKIMNTSKKTEIGDWSNLWSVLQCQKPSFS